MDGFVEPMGQVVEDAGLLQCANRKEDAQEEQDGGHVDVAYGL